MPTQTRPPGRSPVATPTTTGTRTAPTPETGRDHAHPSGGQPAVEERRTEAVADAGDAGPSARSVDGGGAAVDERDDQHQHRPAELGDQGHRPGAAAPGEEAAVEVAQAVRRRREQRQQDAHVATTPAIQTQVAASAATSSITMLSPTALSECTVDGQASAAPTRRSSAR